MPFWSPQPYTFFRNLLYYLLPCDIEFGHWPKVIRDPPFAVAPQVHAARSQGRANRCCSHLKTILRNLNFPRTPITSTRSRLSARPWSWPRTVVLWSAQERYSKTLQHETMTCLT